MNSINNVKVIEQALEVANKNGAFTLKESSVIFQALQYIKQDLDRLKQSEEAVTELSVVEPEVVKSEEKPTDD